jgi:Galactose oxidase, central domain
MQVPSPLPSVATQRQVLNKRARGCESQSSESSWDVENSEEDFPIDNYKSQSTQDPAAQTTVDDKCASQGKRVRFADEEHSKVQEQPPVDDPKAPWTPVPIASSSSDTSVRSFLPYGRWGTSFTRIDAETAIVIGGESDQCGLFDEILTLSLSEGTWTQGLASNDLGRLRLSSPRSWHSATRVGTSILVFGGEVQNADGEREQTSDLLSLDINYGLWVSLQSTGTVPSPRAGHCTALLPDGETLCVFGGISGSRWLADCHLLNVPQLEWKRSKNGARSSSPAARSYATLTTIGEFVVLFGGNNKSRSFSDVFIGTVQDKKDSTKSMVWTEPLLLGAGPAARTGHFAVASPSKKAVIIGGGWDDLGAQRVFHPDIWELLINTRAECRWRLIHRGWSGPTPPLSQPGARAGAAVCECMGDGEDFCNPVLFGGFRGFQYFGDAFELDLSKC